MKEVFANDESQLSVNIACAQANVEFNFVLI